MDVKPLVLKPNTQSSQTFHTQTEETFVDECDNFYLIFSVWKEKFEKEYALKCYWLLENKSSLRALVQY